MGEKNFCSLASWPEYDESKTVDSAVEIAVQVNGKLKSTISLPLNADKTLAIETAKKEPKVSAAIDGKTIVKEIVVPNKIVNIVVK